MSARAQSRGEDAESLSGSWTEWLGKASSRPKKKTAGTEQIPIPVGAVGTSTSSRATISKAALHRIWRVQEELERRLRANQIKGNTCIRTGDSPTAGCAVLSPTGWWTDEAALLRDEDVHRTLSGRPPARGAITLPLTLSDTFVGIGRDRQVSILTSSSQTIPAIASQTL